MEGKGVRASALVVVVMLMIGWHATAVDPAQCFKQCMMGCASLAPEVCVQQCGKRCKPHTAKDLLYYCSFGCSLDQCTKFGNDAEKVRSCMQYCSNDFCKTKGT